MPACAPVGPSARLWLRPALRCERNTRMTQPGCRTPASPTRWPPSRRDRPNPEFALNGLAPSATIGPEKPRTTKLLFPGQLMHVASLPLRFAAIALLLAPLVAGCNRAPAQPAAGTVEKPRV